MIVWVDRPFKKLIFGGGAQVRLNNEETDIFVRKDDTIFIVNNKGSERTEITITPSLEVLKTMFVMNDEGDEVEL